MRRHFSRREFLATSLGTAGVLAASGLSRAEVAEKVYYPSVKLPVAVPTAPVAIQRCRSYDPAAMREKLNAALNLTGGLKKLVANKTVSIKVNVTGGPGTLADLPGYRTYQIHPNLLAALCAALADAGTADDRAGEPVLDQAARRSARRLRLGHSCDPIGQRQPRELSGHAQSRQVAAVQPA